MTTAPADFGTITAAIAATAIAGASSLEFPQTVVGWLGILGILMAAVALYRAGSVRAWKETAEARGDRIEDLERELGELRAELAIPERIEGIIRIMDETATRQDDAARARLESALDRVEERWAKHDAAAEVRTQRLERGHDRIESDLAELVSLTKGEAT